LRLQLAEWQNNLLRFSCARRFLAGRALQKSSCSAVIGKISIRNFSNQWRFANSSAILVCDRKHFHWPEEAQRRRVFNGNVRPAERRIRRFLWRRKIRHLRSEGQGKCFWLVEFLEDAFGGLLGVFGFSDGSANHKIIGA